MNKIYLPFLNVLHYLPKKLCLVIALIIFSHVLVNAQNATQANISGTNSATTISNNIASVVDANITLTANGSISGFTVSITGSYTSGDVLGYNGILPSGISAAAFNTATRSLVFSGTTTAANWQALMRTVTLKTTSAVCNPESRLVSFVVGIKYYNILNGHFYEYYSTGTSWTGAKTYASNYSYYGREGYLATLTSQSENSFVSVLIGQNSWIGCADNLTQVNAALGYNLYASQTAIDGNFYWCTGPERGMKISAQNAFASGGVMPVSGVYNNWTSGEPNDYPNNAIVGEEDYGHMYAGTALWNDFPNTSSIGSIIEFGGMPNDIATSQVVFTRSVYINGAPSGTISGGNNTVCSGTNSTALTLTGLSGTIVRWESSLDNFLTTGTTIANTGTTYTATNISNTTYYRAVVNTSGGCSSLATSSTPVYVSTTIAGNIVASNNTICAGASASFTLFGNSGSVVKWQVSTSSTFASSVTDISNTTTALSYALASTGTYYFRAAVQNNGCGSAVYTPGYSISVISGTAPIGGTVSSAEHCGGTLNTGTLTLSGYTGTVSKWQYSTDGGIIWTDVVNVTNTLIYTGISANRLYRAYLITGTCGSAYSAPGSITVYGTTVTRWDGGTSTAWQTASNWCGGVADNGIDVVISASAVNDLLLDQNRIIGSLNFNNSNHYISLGNSTLTAAGFTNINSTNYIRTNGSGFVKTNIPNGGSATFPVGDGSYNSLIITNNTGSADYFTVRVLNEVFDKGYTGYTSSVGRVKRTWDISKTNPNGGSGLTLQFNWNSGETYNLVTPTLYHYENNTWNRLTGSFSSVGNSLTYTGYLGTFSPFAIGSGLIMLPVNMLDFEAKAQIASRSTLLTWQTGVEGHAKYYEIQRSADDRNWFSIGKTESNDQATSYEFTDANPLPVNYYRLKQVDVDGQSSLHVVRKIMFDGNAEDPIKVFPNPSKGFVEISALEPATFNVEDINGRIVMQGDVNGQTRLDDLTPGIYIVHVVMGEQVYHIKLLMQ